MIAVFCFIFVLAYSYYGIGKILGVKQYSCSQHFIGGNCPGCHGGIDAVLAVDHDIIGSIACIQKYVVYKQQEIQLM